MAIASVSAPSSPRMRADDAVDPAGVAVDHAGADRLDGRLADQRARRGELDLGSLAARVGERLERDLDAGADDRRRVFAAGGDDVVGDRGAEVDAPRRRRRACRSAATALTRRSAPSSRGLSRRIGMPVLQRRGRRRHLVAEVALGPSAPTPARARARWRTRSRPSSSASSTPRSSSRLCSAAPSSSAVAVRTVAMRQCSTSSSPCRSRSASGCCRRRRRAACGAER